MSRLTEITERLRAITAELSDSELDEGRAAGLSKEAAELAAEASREVDRALDEAPADE
jgi:hypothetical protein